MKKVEMHVPNKSYDGYYGGVKFEKGVGVFTDIEMAEDLAGRYNYELVYITDEPEVQEEEVKEVKEAPKKRSRKKADKAGE